MPLLIALALLGAVLAAGIALGLLGLLRRPFLPPAWQPVLPALLALRAVALVAAMGVTALVVHARQPDGLGPFALGAVVGLGLGAASGASAQLDAARFGVRQRPRRVFAALLALAVLGRAVAGVVDGIGGGAMHATLAPLAGLLLGYPLAHALALRRRARSFRRLRPTP